MLLGFTLVVMLVVAVAMYRNGVFSSFVMTIEVVIAGIVAFGSWEPVADELDALFQDGAMAGYEDCIALTTLFVVALIVLRMVANRINVDRIDFNYAAEQIAGPAIGLVTGYLVAGFLICVFQTLPVEDHFLGFTTRSDEEPRLRSYLPPDRVWLALMRYAGAHPLAWQEENPDGETPFDRWATFDRLGTFELRYERYRRHPEGREPRAYPGDFEDQLGRKK